MNAMILAAGLGTRLNPLTDYCPKPIAPVLNAPLIHHNLYMLHRAGVKRTIVNIHFMPEKMQAALETKLGFDMEIHYSMEPDAPLGSGGGLKLAKDFLREDTFFLVNGDILFQADLEKALLYHRQKNALATMMLKSIPDMEEFGPVGADNQSKIRKLVSVSPPEGTPLKLGVFTGVHIIEPAVLKLLPEKESFCIVRGLYVNLLQDDPRIYAHFSEGFWNALETPQRYFESQLEILNRPQLLRYFLDALGLKSGDTQGIYYTGEPEEISSGAALSPPCLIGEGVVIEPGARIGPDVIVGKHSVIGAGAEVRSSIIWPESKIKPGAAIADSVVYPGGILDVSMEKEKQKRASNTRPDRDSC